MPPPMPLFLSPFMASPHLNFVLTPSSLSLFSPKRDRDYRDDSSRGRRGDDGGHFDSSMRRGPSGHSHHDRSDHSSHYNDHGQRDYNDRGRYHGGDERDAKRRKESDRDSSSRYPPSSSSHANNSDRRPYPPPQQNAPSAQLAKRVLPDAQTALGSSDAFSQPSMPVLDDETYAKRIEAHLAAQKSAESEESEIEKRRKRLRELMEKEEALKRQQPSAATSAPVKPIATPISNHTTKVEVTGSGLNIGIPKPAPVSMANPISLLMQEVDSDDDMFGDSFVDKAKEETAKSISSGATKEDARGLGALVQSGATLATDATCDDDEGYYNFRVGELLGGGKYEVLGYYGKGVYSNVIKAKNLKKQRSSAGGGSQNPLVVPSESLGEDDSIVAIKLLRNNAHMKRSGRKEVKVLKMLEEADEQGKGYCLRLEEVFEEKRHLCLVFPAYDLNLTQVIKHYGHHVGINIKAVRSYAFKMVKALHLLKRVSILHADIKPDNILVSADRSEVILADFGTALELQEVEVTNQMVSRYYRAPEIILGFTSSISFPIDMWSIGCCLYEMATGKYLMPSKSENEHIKMSFEIGGPFNKKLLSSAHPPYIEPHFSRGTSSNSNGSGSGSESADFLFLEHYPDPAGNGNLLVRKIPMPVKPTRLILPELLQSFESSSSSLSPTEMAWIHRLADLITQCLALDPKKRITPEQALQHSFF